MCFVIVSLCLKLVSTRSDTQPTLTLMTRACACKCVCVCVCVCACVCQMESMEKSGGVGRYKGPSVFARRQAYQSPGPGIVCVSKGSDAR